MPGPMLELDRVETYRGPAQILRSVSLALGAGEAVCLVGRNGAGKTTTIDTIMGLLPSRSGRVRFKGQDVTRLPAHQRAQSRSAVPTMPVGNETTRTTRTTPSSSCQ